MHIYIVKEDKTVEEVIVINHSQEEIDEYFKELQDKNGKAKIFLSETKLKELENAS